MWQRVRTFFKDSEVLFWARLQALLGFIGSITAVIDPSLLEPLLTPKGLALYMLANGLLTEYLRRRRDSEM